MKRQTPLYCAILGIDVLDLSTRSSISASTGTEENTSMYDSTYTDVDCDSARSWKAIVSLLLAHNDIRVDLKDDNGLTPLMLARSLEL
ncbi:hypothetical protein SERLA73DRAFT_182141 [Serpula lacrymans var. lacrymans S7.3]|uniref:Uncharacterized protein n=2 Tax=Serpula lacrymans var. lacrymans TaxID=341189 RepID=F8PWR1_SERL3|nr:uncharacterized protein SERLADRAFT_468656 [Serpula lacrymans var. lacrymans S7.9]EGN99238.1 hypothetical protein SERLA73DRAFT_182141 [Serpula lacrymans var. lacrymans S7.3]EGO24805.1 hypothetical protein SERLADRAFT_468656 [Serpula lacrymans var. lacrymans S7.9]